MSAAEAADFMATAKTWIEASPSHYTCFGHSTGGLVEIPDHTPGGGSVHEETLRQAAYLLVRAGQEKEQKQERIEAQRRGDPKFEAICPLCLHNDETQAHILLRCCHPAMKYWRDEYFARCSRITKGTKDPVIEAYLGGLWGWIAKPLDKEDPTIIVMDSRRVALMMGRPIREDLERPGSQTQLTANQIKKCSKPCWNSGKPPWNLPSRPGAREAA
jgi:hypothetical protein